MFVREFETIKMNPRIKKKILDEIEIEFQSLEADIPDLNYGGCGIFAEEAYKLLVSLGLTPRIAVLARGSRGEVKSEIVYGITNNLSGRVVPFNHVLLKLGGRYIDSGGVYRSLKEMDEPYSNMICVTGMQLDLLEEWNKDRMVWNYRFKRTGNVQRIRRTMNKIRKNLVNKYNIV
jgi:hypothetical protein